MKNQELKIVVPCAKSFDLILVSNIIRCAGMQNYTKLFLIGGTSIISSCNIGSFKQALVNHNFFSCHKSHLISKSKILRYHKVGQVEMIDGSMVPVARRRKEMFLNDLLHNDQIIQF